MQAWQIYHDGIALQFQWKTAKKCVSESMPAQRICSISSNLLMVLTADGNLLAAQLEKDNKTLKLELQQSNVQDIDYCKHLRRLYVVTNEGTVLTKTYEGGDINELIFGDWETLTFDPLELSEDGIRLRRVCCSEYGALFVTYNHEIYAIGSCGDVFNVDPAQPKHMRIFDETQFDAVLDVVAGEEFFVLLLRRRYDDKVDPLDLHGRNNINPMLNTITKGISTSITNNGATTSKRPSQSTSASNLQHQSADKYKLTPDRELANNGRQARHDLNSNSSLHSYSGSSTKSSQASHDFESLDVTKQLLYHGYGLLHTQVFTFGAVNNGVLGTGDHIKRIASNHIKKLDAMGVCSIASGREHTVVRTLDGRLFHWGLNTKQQLESLKSDNEHIDISAPTEFLSGTDFSAAQHSILAACCGDFKTVLLNAHGNLSTKHGSEYSNNDSNTYTLKEFLSLQLSSGLCKREYPMLLAAGNFTVHNQRHFREQFYACYTALQLQLKQLLKSANVIRMLNAFQQRKSGTANALKQLQPVCVGYQKLLCLITATVKSIESYYCAILESPADLLFIKHHREYIAIFEAYTRANCDVYSVDGYADASKILTHYSALSMSSDNGEQRVAGFDLAVIFQQPLQALPGFLQFLEQLSKTQHEYAEHLLAWQSYSRQNTIDLELAENTHDFWQRNERNMKIRHFRRRHRRVILTSSMVPLKLSQGLSISSPTFILFSDCLCQLSGQLYTYPLLTMWLKIESDTALRIITPEKSLILTARSHHDKMLWFDQLESSILAALGRPSGAKLSSVRTTNYVFSNSHAKYAGVHAYGRWRNGVLHGNCYLEYPEAKIYFGEMRHGEIEGYGKMVIPSIGLYEGTFKSGKFHGHGTYELKDSEVYEGSFRDGLFHGHGLLRNNNYTYVGEYQANAKCGYGVLDDMVSGDKYMGMFADNKRIGAGTCITMTGDYFEGIFANDELAGAGIAVFENDYYYVGELGMQGPSGKGIYYMPVGVVDTESTDITVDDDISNRVLVGNVVSGQLGGTWQDLRVVSGNVAINRHFPKYPKSIGELVVDNKRKWRALFENFEEEIFGATIGDSASTPHQHTADSAASASTTASATKMYWSRIAVFMTTQREREKSLEQQDALSESRHSYFAHNISMGFANRSFDRLSLKSATSLFSEATMFDFRSSSSRYIKAEASPKRSQSQETLYDSTMDLNDLDYYQPPSDELHSFSSFPTTYLSSWANDTMSGAGSYAHDGIGASTPSLRSSYDSIFNLNGSFNNNNNSYSSTLSSQAALEYVPSFGITTLSEFDVNAIKEYLAQAFKDRHHPLYLLNQRITNCFYISYGCWKVKPTPILAKQAMYEWESISRQIYQFVRKLFPALPLDYCVMESSREVISHITLLYPIVLTEGIYSTLFVLYANKYSRKDELYRQNLVYAKTLPDDDLAKILGLEISLLAVVGNSLFVDAIQTLKQLQEKYSPKAMLNIIEQCMQLITDAHKMVENANSVILAADSMMPLTLFLVLRAAVPHLGAELALLDDLTGGANFQFEMNGIAGYCYTTLKAAYEHITGKPLQNKTT